MTTPETPPAPVNYAKVVRVPVRDVKNQPGVNGARNFYANVTDKNGVLLPGAAKIIEIWLATDAKAETLPKVGDVVTWTRKRGLKIKGT